MKKTLFCVAAVMGLAGSAAASPWLDPDDPRARHSLQRLADRGCVNLPTSTWPVMWADLSPQLDRTDVPASCRQSQAWQYLTFERNYQRDNTIQGHVTVAGASDTALFKGFDNLPRDEGEVTLGVEWTGGRWSAALKGTYAVDPYDDRSGRMDGSYVATSLGNWAMGLGVLDRWWGPGWQSSTIYSTNARPIPALFLNRQESKPLPFIGRWSAVAMLGQLEGDRDYSDAKFLGMRVTVRPAHWVEVGVSRTAIWGGSGRPQSLGSFWDVVVGKDNDAGQDPSNQLGGADVRFAIPLGRSEDAERLGVYLQVTGEDEAGGLPSKFMGLAGLDWSSQWWGGEQRWFAEFTDTTAGAWSSEKRPNVAYEHHRYATGYRFNGRNIASTWEGDSRIYTLGASHFFADGRDLSLTLSHGTLNDDGTARLREDVPGLPPLLDPQEEEDITVLTANYRFVLLKGRMTVSAWYLDKGKTEALDDWSDGGVSAAWEFRFH